jgi:hypothetical protein
MPSPKKHVSTRARTNKASTAASLAAKPAAKRRTPRPKLPVRLDELGDTMAWHPQTTRWWTDLWSAPMAKEYHSSDRHTLFVLAGLVEDYWRATSAAGRKDAATEIRLQRKDFGLTPYDRRRLEWTIDAPGAPKERGQAGRASRQPKPAEDPRLTLVQ